MQPQDSSSAQNFAPGSAAARLLDAAIVVFSRDGISGATTREIAREAGVNEVTLFRNFQTKQGLLVAVLERAFPAETDGGPADGKGNSVTDFIRAFAVADFARKRANISLMRVLIGESHRLGEYEAGVLKDILRPWKDRLVSRIREAKDAGQVRDEVDPGIVVDQLVAMIFIGAMRAEKTCTGYTPEAYLDACVDMVLNSILVRRPGKTRK